MRFFKDSHSENNPRGRFWESQYGNARKHLLLKFNINRQLFEYRERFYVNHILLVESENWLWKGISKYIPYHMNPLKRMEYFLVGTGIFLAVVFNQFEVRYWKEKKWDKEPGEMIPLRQRGSTRLVNYLIEIKLKPLLYYLGLFVEDKDLDMNVDLAQVSEGRKYRRFLCMQYARKMKYQQKRINQYDFIEVSPDYHKD